MTQKTDEEDRTRGTPTDRGTQGREGTPGAGGGGQGKEGNRPDQAGEDRAGTEHRQSTTGRAVTTDTETMQHTGELSPGLVGVLVASAAIITAACALLSLLVIGFGVWQLHRTELVIRTGALAVERKVDEVNQRLRELKTRTRGGGEVRVPKSIFFVGGGL